MKKYTSTNRTQLAQKYQVSYTTLKNWLAQIPNLDLNPQKRILTPKQVSIIIEHLGEPPDD